MASNLAADGSHEKPAFLQHVADLDLEALPSPPLSPSASSQSSRTARAGHSAASSTSSTPFDEKMTFGELDNEYTFPRRRSKRQMLVHCLASIPRGCLAFWSFFIPSFLKGAGPAKRRIFPTSHLDGLRGLAAFIVSMFHVMYSMYPTINGYGSDAFGQDNHYFFQFPIVNLLFTGHPWVAIFFVISGYSLSIKPLKLMHRHAWSDLQEALTSAVFRRGFCLFVPIVISTFAIMWLANLDVFEMTRAFAEDENGMLNNYKDHHMPKRVEWLDQWMDFYISFKRVLGTVWCFEQDVFAGSNHHDLHLWTIPVEYRCSLVLFLCHAAVARMRPAVRVATMTVFWWFARHWGRWDVMLFIGGFIVAEYDMLVAARLPTGWHSQSHRTPSAKSIMFWVWHAFFGLVLFVGLFLLSYPGAGADTTQGYVWLSQHIPAPFLIQDYRYWTTMGAIVSFFAVCNMSAIAAIFNTRIMQYLGRISFGLYIMHGLLLHTFGYWFAMHWFPAWGITSVERGSFHYVVAFGIWVAACVASFVWAGDVFTRAVDEPVVRLVGWTYRKLSVGDA